ncbi:MAG: hypothetical protein IJR85_03610 [Synergistaceae bacterium]|nr:hypothetical protein [Synergistaceae bacterium]
MRKFILILLAVMLAISMSVSAWGASELVLTVDANYSGGSGDDDDDSDSDETTFTTLAEALSYADSDEATDVIINLLQDENLEGYMEIDDATDKTSITIAGTGSTKLILPSDEDNEGVRHFVINNSDFTLGLKGLTISGGGVYVVAGTLSADSVTFSNNDPSGNEDTSDRIGGAVHVAEDGKAAFTNCVFTNNTSARGGAIYSAGELEVSPGTAFTRNHATENGGAIYSAGTRESTFNGLTFGGNTNGDANYAANGGAVYISAGSVTFSNSIFTRNSADQGGAISVASGTLNLTGVNTLENNRGNNGGAIYLADSNNARLEFSGSETMILRGNTAQTAGGAIYAEENSVMVAYVAVTFDGNHADGGNGGALWVSDGKQLEGFAGAITFTNNTADYGGAVYIGSEKQNTANFTAQGQFDFSNNEAEYEGGAIYTVRANVLVSGLEISTENTAGLGGGFLKAGGSTTIKDSTISNQSAKFGGAIFSSGAIVIDNSVFSYNSSEVEDGDDQGGGGAIYYAGRGTGPGQNITITSSDFINNTSTTNNIGQGGGALFISGDASISGSRFTSNTHTNNANIDNGGGAIYLNGSITLESTEFTSNRAAGTGGTRGGAIYATGGSTISIKESLFESNQATNNGGAIVLSGQCTTTIEDSTFTSNQSTSAFGGAVYAQGTLTAQNSYFYLNRSAQSGGAIYFDQHNNANHPGMFTAESSMFMENSAGAAPLTGQGGALYLRPDAAVINRCTFANNQSSAVNADSRGGAIYIDTNDTAVATVTSIKNSTFAGNQVYGGSTNYGGAIFLTGQDIALISDTFTGGNSAIERGGAVYVGSGTMTIAACIIVGNTADNGRDIYAEGTITSRGYNRIGVYGKGGNDTSWLADITTSTTDRENSAWTMVTFFGEDSGLVDNDGFVQGPDIGSALKDGKVKLLAIPLNEMDSLLAVDRATNAIPFARRFTLNIDQYDIWGIDRFSGNNDITIGAHYLGGDGAGGGDGEAGLYEIASISMSGIPNTLKSIGQTSSLVAVIHYINGRTAYGVPSDRTSVTKNQEERVTWSSSMPAFVKIDKSGNITALQMTNNTNGATITVSTVRATPGGRAATDSRAVKVTGQYSFMNTVSQAYQNYFSDYVQDLMEHDISISLAEADKSTVLATGFQRNFASLWGVTKASAVTDLSVSTPSFSTATTYTNSQGLAASNGAGVSINFQNRSAGDLFPLTYSWNLSGKQVQAILGNDMTRQSINDSFADKLFSAMRIDYQTPTKNSTVVGSGGVKGSDARRYGALTMTKADGNAGLHIELTAYLANVASNASSNGPQFVKGSGSKRLLVVPDGANDTAITGTMWLAQSASTIVKEDTPSTNNNNSGGDSTGNNTTGNNSNSGGGGGGGGGCDSFGLGLFGAVLVLALKRK